MRVEAEFGSIFKAVNAKASKMDFWGDMATQITLKGNLDNLPIYIKSEEGRVEVAPYEYNGNTDAALLFAKAFFG